MSASASVQVVVRLRPMNDKEQTEGTLPVVSSSTTTKTITVIKGAGSKQARSTFNFDNVFGSFSTQQEIFGATLRPVIADVLKGYETCVFAYGQTGTGKTHTMEGDLKDPEEFGVIPRSAQAIFDALESSQYTESTVSCSYLEIYNEELSDLLVEQQTKLEIMNSGRNGVTCRGLTTQTVSSAQDVLRLMANAGEARRVGETRMNKQSSRSHCIFTINVTTSQLLPDGNVMDCQGKLHMVDLAGSESAKTAELKDSSAKEQATREQERRNINKSLLTLGRVITTLKEQGEGQKKIAPYRDSKLTRILQEALGGRCKTVVIATVSPSVMNLQESLQTLNYATKANGIQNKPVSSSYLSVSALTGTPSKSGERAMPAERWQEMEIRMQHMQQEVEEARQALARNYMHQQEWEERVLKAERAQEDLTKEVETKQKQVEALEESLELERQTRKATEEELKRTKTTLTKTTAVLKATQETEASLTSEAMTLLQALSASITDGDSLHNMVQTNREEDVERRNLTRKFHASVTNLLKTTVSKLETICNNEKEHLRELEGVLVGSRSARLEAIEEAIDIMSSVSELVASTAASFNELHSEKFIPQLTVMAESIDSNAEETRAMVVEGDTTLSSSCNDARRQLELFADRLHEMDTQHKKITGDWLKDVEKSLTESKTKIQSVVDSSTASILEAQDKGMKVRKTLSELLLEWQKHGSDTTEQLKGIAATQKTALKQNHELLASEMKRHETVGQNLSSQVDFLKEKRRVQSAAFGRQVEHLEFQSKIIEASQKEQQQLSESIVATVMKTVKNLIEEQMQAVVNSHSKTAAALIAKNQELMSSNQGLNTESDCIFDQVALTNTALCSDTIALRDTNVVILDTLKEAKSAVDEVHDVVENYRVVQNNYATSGSENMSSLASVSETIGSIRGTLLSDGKDCVQHLHSSTHEVALKALSEVSESGKKVVDFAKNDVIEQGVNAINKIEKPRAASLEKLLVKLNSIKESSKDGLEAVQSVAEEEVKEISRACKSVVAKADELTAISKIHRSRCDQDHEKITSSLSSHNESVQCEVSECKKNLFQANEGVDRFGKNTIQMEDQVEAAPKRITVDFSEELTSTPDEDTIFKSIDMNGADLTTGTPRVAGEKTSSVHDYAKENTLNDENSASSSIKSPPLRENFWNNVQNRAEDVRKVAPRKRIGGKSKSRLPKRKKTV